jgi:hypothetical protein
MSDNNGWAGKPGVPLNPKRDGAHWLKGYTEDACMWQDGGWYIPGYSHKLDAETVASRYSYLGPCLTPAEVDARIAAARKDALAVAAQWHDEQAVWMIKGRRLAKAEEHRKHAAAIRALSDTPPGMVLVPREPTSKMHDAGFAVSVGGLLGKHMGYDFCTANRRIWIAMVEAAEKGNAND